MAITISGENNNDRILATDGVIDSLSGFNVVGVITATSFTGDLTGDVTGNLTGNVTGNINNSTLLLQTGGNERLRITSTGRVFIGESSVAGSANLVIGNGGAENFEFTSGAASTYEGGVLEYIHRGDGNTRPNLNYYVNNTGAHKFWTGGSERLRITSGGNVDINGTPPWSVTGGDYRNLSISGQTASSSGFIWLGNGAAATNADFDLGRINFMNGGTIVARVVGTTDTSANDDGRLRFITKKTGETEAERLRITSSGQVNIGNTGTSWVGPLSIGSGASGAAQVLQIYSNSDTYGAIFFGDATSGAGRYVGDISYYHDNNYMRFSTAGYERLRIDSTGVARFVNPTGEFKIASSTGNDGGKIILQENTLGAWSLEAQRANGFFRISDEYNNNAGSPQEYFRISTNGRVSISNDGTSDGLLTIKGNSDATGNPSIRLLDGSDTREASISNTSGDLIISTHGTDNVEHGSIKIHETGFISLSTNAGAGNAARLKVDLVGSMRHMGTSGYYQITVIHNGSGSGNWYSGSGPQRIYPNYIDNRTGYAEFLIEFHPSVSYSGWEEPTFVICTGNQGGMRTGGTVELNTNRRTNAPNNAVFRAYHGQYSWQIYNDGDSDQTSGQREINRNVEHRTSYWIDPSTQSIDYIHSLDSRYNTNVEPLLNQRSFIKIKINKTSNTSHAVQGHPFVCRFVCYSQGDTEWYGYMQYN